MHWIEKKRFLHPRAVRHVLGILGDDTEFSTWYSSFPVKHPPLAPMWSLHVTCSNDGSCVPTVLRRKIKGRLVTPYTSSPSVQPDAVRRIYERERSASE